MSATILVLDAEQRAALAVVRSLGVKGCAVHVASHQRAPIAGGSRFALTESRVPNPLAPGEDYAVAVSALATRRGATLVIPITEASSWALLERPDALPRGMVPMGDLGSFRRASDKAGVLALASHLGIDVPQQWTVSSRADLTSVLPSLTFPIIVKPSRSVVETIGGRSKTTVRHAADAESLERIVAGLGEESGPLLLQARIIGPGLGVFLLRWDGEFIAAFAHRRIREKPPSGGVSVCSESVPLSERLHAQSQALLAALDWKGVAMVEFKRDQTTGRDYLMEVNPRFWGSLQLAIDAGVDFPWRLVQAALGNPLDRVHGWRTGIRSRWALGEVDHLIALTRRSSAELNLPPDAPSLAQTLTDIITPWPLGQRNDVFRFRDPLPFVREATQWVLGLRKSQ